MILSRDAVFGTHLKLLGEFPCDSTGVIDPFILVSLLQLYKKTLRTLPARLNFHPTYIPNNLTTCTHVLFVASVRPL